MRCWIYFIRCRNFALYTGVTNNPKRRWAEHKSGQGARYIRANGFVEPVFLQEFENKSKAMKEEIFIKRQDKAYKEKLIKSKRNIIKTVLKDE